MVNCSKSIKVGRGKLGQGNLMPLDGTKAAFISLEWALRTKFPKRANL